MAYIASGTLKPYFINWSDDHDDVNDELIFLGMVLYTIAFILQFSGTLYCRERVLINKGRKTNKLGKKREKKPTIRQKF